VATAGAALCCIAITTQLLVAYTLTQFIAVRTRWCALLAVFVAKATLFALAVMYHAALLSTTIYDKFTQISQAQILEVALKLALTLQQQT
jgi:hypothetical protein